MSQMHEAAGWICRIAYFIAAGYSHLGQAKVFSAPPFK